MPVTTRITHLGWPFCKIGPAAPSKSSSKRGIAHLPKLDGHLWDMEEDPEILAAARARHTRSRPLSNSSSSAQGDGRFRDEGHSDYASEFEANGNAADPRHWDLGRLVQRCPDAESLSILLDRVNAPLSSGFSCRGELESACRREELQEIIEKGEAINSEREAYSKAIEEKNERRIRWLQHNKDRRVTVHPGVALYTPTPRLILTAPTPENSRPTSPVVLLHDRPRERHRVSRLKARHIHKELSTAGLLN